MVKKVVHCLLKNGEIINGEKNCKSYEPLDNIISKTILSLNTITKFDIVIIPNEIPNNNTILVHWIYSRHKFETCFCVDLMDVWFLLSAPRKFLFFFCFCAIEMGCTPLIWSQFRFMLALDWVSLRLGSRQLKPNSNPILYLFCCSYYNIIIF